MSMPSAEPANFKVKTSEIIFQGRSCLSALFFRKLCVCVLWQSCAQEDKQTDYRQCRDVFHHGVVFMVYALFSARAVILSFVPWRYWDIPLRAVW